MKTTFEQINLYTTLWRETNMLYETWAKQHGLSYYELLVILSISQSDTLCKQKDICQQWLLPKQTVNSILKHFSEHSWVTLTPSKEDRRNKDIALTDIGHEYFNRITHEMEQHECAVWDSMGAEYAKALIDSTALYNKLFKEVSTNETA